jgi:AAA15 family ATPase/GTPase
MLVNLRISNCLSFRDEVEFTALASRERRHGEQVFRHSKLGLNLLPVAALYGANGAGKSNLYYAIRFARRFILRSRARPEDAIDVEPFRLDRECLTKPSAFSFDFLIDDQVYRYSFAATRQRVVSESLEKVNGNKASAVFTRDWQGDKPVWNVEYFKRLGLPSDEFQFIEFKTRDTLPNQLFLSETRGHKLPVLEAVGRWFRNKLCLLDPHSEFKPVEIGLRKVETFREYSVQSLQRAGTGINSIKNDVVSLETIPIPSELRNLINKQLETAPDGELVQVVGPERQRFFAYREGGQVKALQLVTFHQDRDGNQVRFEMPDESEGTQRLIDLLPAFFELSSPDTEKVFFIDELDRSLHSHLTRGLLESFLRNRTNSSRGQLLFTTHDALLLDQELLRRDEIWFLDKDERGQSTLTALSDFKGVRHDKDIRRSYLLGRFGGVPSMRSLPRRAAELTSQPQ